MQQVPDIFDRTFRKMWITVSASWKAHYEDRWRSTPRWQRYTGNGRELYGDGNVFTHQYGQTTAIEIYGNYDLDADTVDGKNLLVTAWLIDSPLSRSDLTQLKVAWLLHDLWETFADTGDVTFDQKAGATSTEREIARGKQVIAEILEGSNANLEEIYDIYSLDFDKSHRLHKLFKVYEKFSYIKWAISAFETIGTPHEIENPVWLCHNVFKNQIAPLLDLYFARVPSVAVFFNQHQETLQKMAEYIDTLGFKDPESEKNDIAYTEAKKYANRYKSLFQVHDAITKFQMVYQFEPNYETKAFFHQALREWIPSLLELYNEKYPTMREYLDTFARPHISMMFQMVNKTEFVDSFSVENDEAYEAANALWNKYLAKILNA